MLQRSVCKGQGRIQDLKKGGAKCMCTGVKRPENSWSHTHLDHVSTLVNSSTCSSSIYYNNNVVILWVWSNTTSLELPYGYKFSRTKIFAVFADQT